MQEQVQVKEQDSTLTALCSSVMLRRRISRDKFNSLQTAKAAEIQFGQTKLRKCRTNCRALKQAAASGCGG
jgi:hypothetical protein